MTENARSKFIRAGEMLYAKAGYRKLSVRALAAEAGLSPGMFHHLFESKDAFVLEMLEQRNRMFADNLEAMSLPENPFEKLKVTMQALARNARDNLQLVHRLFADSADGVEIVNDFIRTNIEMRINLFSRILEECARLDGSVEASAIQRLGYFASSVSAPMILASRFRRMGLLPEALSREVDGILSDEAICQRIDWSMRAMFPNHMNSLAEQEKP